MKVTMLLCDHAQVADNKLFINGAGWDMCPAPSPPHAVAILVSVPWGATNTRHEYQLELVDEDNRPVTVVGAAGTTPIGAAGGFEVGRPPGLRPGTDISVPLVVGVAPIPLRPDTGYTWRLSIDGASAPGWSLSFRTR